jgi:hypothetical protein
MHAIVPRFPVGENAIKHGGFVGRRRRIGGLRDQSRMQHDREDSDCRRGNEPISAKGQHLEVSGVLAGTVERFTSQ